MYAESVNFYPTGVFPGVGRIVPARGGQYEYAYCRAIGIEKSLADCTARLPGDVGGYRNWPSGLNWRKFTTALDAISLTEAEEQRLFAGARDAFARVASLVEATLPPDEPRSEAREAEAVS